MNLVYRNRFNEVKAYSVNVVAENNEYLDVFDKNADRIKTFKQSNVLSTEETFKEASDKAEALQNDYQIIERKISSGKSMPSRDSWVNRENKFEVCFTGFAKDEKAELIKFAKENELFIRTAVSKNLGLLVCGKSAGWKKLEVANKLNVPREIGVEGFYAFLETGEFSE